MGCKSSTKTWGPRPVWSGKSNSVWVFHPLSAPMDSTGVDKVRVSFEMRQNSGDAEIRPAYRMTDDAITWGTPIAIGTATRTQDGVTNGSQFYDESASTDDKSLVQFGIECKNGSGAALEMCMAALKVDIKEG